MTLSEFFQKYNTILIHDVPWVQKALKLTFEEFDQQLQNLVESGEVENRSYGNFGLRAWGVPMNFKPTREQLDRLMEIINDLDHFTPSSLYTHQFPVLRLNKPMLTVAIETLYEQERILRGEEKRAGNVTYQTYTSAIRKSPDEDVYTLLRDHGPHSKSMVAKQTGLSRYRVDQILAQMVKEKSIRKRPGELFEIVSDDS